MVMSTTGSHDFEVLAADGTTWIGLMIARPTDQGGNIVEGQPVTLEEALVAANNDVQISKRLVPQIQEDWSRGIGLDYSAAYGLNTRTPGFVVPAGRVTQVPLATNFMHGRTSAFAEFGNDLWVGVGQIVYQVSGGTAAPLAALTMAGNMFVRDLITADNGSGTTYLYAFATDSGGGNGQIYQFNGAVWSAPTSFAPYERGRVAKVYWAGANQVGAQRLVTISGANTISYTLPNTNPMLVGSWVEGIKIGTSRPAASVTGSRRHIYITSPDGTFDINELGESVNLISYQTRSTLGSDGYPAAYLDGFVYTAPNTGLERVRVDQGAVLTEAVGQCAPGWGTHAENLVAGQVTDLTVDQGYLVAAVFNVVNLSAYVCWGKPRETLGIESPNPLIWYGPETIVVGYGIDRMHVSGLGGDLRLWMVGLSNDQTTPILLWQSLPNAASPIQDLISAGTHRYATGTATPIDSFGRIIQPYCRLFSMPRTWDDRASLKIVHQHAVGTRNLNAATGTRLDYYDRADPNIDNVTWPAGVGATGSSWPTPTAVSTGPVQEIAPSAVVSGHTLEERIDFFSPLGSATPPKVAILDSLRTTAWRVAPDFGVIPLDAEYGAGVVDLANVEDDRDPDDVTDALIALTRIGPTTLRSRDDKRWSCKLEQVADRVVTFHESGAYGKSVKVRLELTIIGAA